MKNFKTYIFLICIIILISIVTVYGLYRFANMQVSSNISNSTTQNSTVSFANSNSLTNSIDFTLFDIKTLGG